MKTILLTGAQGGIGSATKVALEATGARVIAVGREDADLSSYEAIVALAERIKKDAPLDWLVFTHGFIGPISDPEKQPPTEVRDTFTINTLSCIYLTQLLLPMVRDGGGIVFISSSAALEPNGRIAAYSASKAAVNTYCQAIARNKPRLHFFSICPGPTNTPMRQRLVRDAARHQSPSVVAEVIAQLINNPGGHKSGDVILIKDGSAAIATRV